MKGRAALERAIGQRILVLSNTLRPSTLQQYRLVVRDFLRYLAWDFPSIQRPDQLRREHILGWIQQMLQRHPPLSPDSRLKRLLCLSRLLEELADLPHPPRPALIHASDLPRPDFRLPAPFRSKTIRDCGRL